jgi:hypothetical protein
MVSNGFRGILNVGAMAISMLRKWMPRLRDQRATIRAAELHGDGDLQCAELQDTRNDKTLEITAS